MPEWLALSIAIYSFGIAVIVFVSAVQMPSNSAYYRLQRRYYARVIIAAPAWPLAIPFYIVYGIYRLIQIARTGK